MSEKKFCPFAQQDCKKEECMLYVAPIEECCFVAINRSIFKQSNANKGYG
jgi:hypothetical protein